MNIFVTSRKPKKCARNLDDKRIGKLLIESAQLLSLAIKRHMIMRHRNWEHLVGPGRLCAGLSYSQHPIALWLCETRGNYTWTLRYGKALATEYTFRYGRIHAASNRLEFLTDMTTIIPNGPQTEFVNCARNLKYNLDFGHMPVIQAYRSYLVARWQTDRRAVRFTRRSLPKLTLNSSSE